MVPLAQSFRLLRNGHVTLLIWFWASLQLSTVHDFSMVDYPLPPSPFALSDEKKEMSAKRASGNKKQLLSAGLCADDRYLG